MVTKTEPKIAMNRFVKPREEILRVPPPLEFPVSSAAAAVPVISVTLLGGGPLTKASPQKCPKASSTAPPAIAPKLGLICTHAAA